MRRPLDEVYLEWLYEHVADKRATPKFWKLLRQLYTTPFYWWVPNDDNRAADGRQLREEFLEDLGETSYDTHWMELECSMLELLLGLARRLSFQANGPPNEWFWIMIDNLDLRYSDRGRFPEAEVEEALNHVIYRTYEYDGSGGLFPLRNPDFDQRDVEMWAQLSAYLLENY